MHACHRHPTKHVTLMLDGEIDWRQIKLRVNDN